MAPACNLIPAMEALLPAATVHLLRRAGVTAAREGALLYLVGGSVRDLLLGRPVMDLDLVAEGDGPRIAEALAANGLGPEAIDWIVPHQANLRILRATGRKLGIGEDRVIVTVDRHANTSAASVPLALAAGVEDGRIAEGDMLLLEAMGGGLTWGAALARW